VRIVAALLLVAVAGCRGWTDTRAPWETSRSHDIGRPVLGFRWKKVIADHSKTNRPQEMAQPAVSALSPAEVAEGRGSVYVGSHDGGFVALSAADGSELWRVEIGPSSGVPLVVGDLVYVGNDEGELFALSTATGKQKWKYQQAGAILRQPVTSGDLLLFSSLGDRVVALDRDSGKWRWQYEREPPDEFTVRGHAGVAVEGEQVLTGFSDGHLVAVARGSGDVLWVRSLAGEAKQFVDVDATPIAKDGVVYAASVQGGLYGLSAADGTERWQSRIQGVTQIVLDEGRLFVAGAESGLHAVDLDGNLVWRQGFARAGDPARPLVDGHYLLLSVAESGLYIIDKRDGTLYQSFLPGPGITAAPTVTGDRIYIHSNGGILYAMNLRHFW
jgi:outer membrane protein assembly factor BamB